MHGVNVVPAAVRRPTLRTAVAAVGLVLATVLAGCAGTPPAAAPAPAAAAATFVMVIRHGEKPDGSDPGVDERGKKDDASLTSTGWERANALPGLFAPDPGPPRAGLATPVAIYAAAANDDGEGKRTRETVTPLAARLGIPVGTPFGKGQEKQLVEQVIAGPGPALISWQHEELPDIAAAFPGVRPTPPSDWPDDVYDVVWTFTRTADGWQFAQLPEQVLPQDGDTVIED